MARWGVNKKGLRRELAGQIQRSGTAKKLRTQISESVKRAKRLMLLEFNAHPVTREIEGGASAHNISQSLGGVGNLYSFIGFGEGDRPIAPVRRILESSTRLLLIRHIKGTLAFEVIIEMPSKDDIIKASPLPWAAARSWVIGIEHGLSGLGQFLVKPGLGRSKGGVQIQGTMRTGGFRNTSYISGKKGILGHLHANLLRFLRE
mgnify:CR=1 FL=1